MSNNTVKNWEQILTNVDNFCEGIKYEDSFTHKHFGQFYNWYYFPDEDRFAPNKFIGYQDTTLDEYNGSGDGGVAKKALGDFFDKVNKDDFKVLAEKLELFSKSIGCSISKSTYDRNIGGIFIPKTKYLNHNISLNDSSQTENVKDIVIKEGQKYYGYSSHYERSPKLRRMVIKTKGVKCAVCGFDFGEKYGDRGIGYIEVHHVFPLSKYNNEKEVDPITDMEVLCSNCHRMVHRSKTNILTIEELKQIIKNKHE